MHDAGIKKDKKRILLIVPDKLQKPVGGVGVQLKHLLSHLESEFDFDIIAQPEENGIPNYISIYNPLPRIEHASLVTIVGQIAYFAAASKCQKPDIVHVYDWSTYLAGIYAAKYFGCPLVVTMNLSINLLERSGITYAHEPNTVDGFWIHRTHCEMELLGLNEADRIVQVSEAYQNRLEEFGAFKEKSVIVPNGIDLEEWRHSMPVTIPFKRKIKLAYIGRFALMKGVLALCEASIPDEIDLIFVGDSNGGEQQVFEQMLQKVKNENNVHYVGPLYSQDKINFLNAVDAVIMPSHHEPFGIVALEALASNNILLASFVDGLSDFLTDDVALRCGTSKVQIEETLRKLVHMTDEEKQERIKKGNEICEQYSWKRAADKMTKVYNDLLSANPSLSL